jgi:G3E family GTPase
MSASDKEPFSSTDVDDSDDDEPPVLVNLVLDPEKAVTIINSENENDDNNDDDADENLPPCPVTILSGFLGSGKTTLIQYILNSPDHGKRIAVIENEFGDGLSIESLIARDGVDPSSNSLTDLIELPNGCICCTVKDDLVSTLENLIEKRKDLDYILIEASGMANPGPIAAVFWLDDELQSRLRLDGIVTLVDAFHIGKQLLETEEASQQIAHADRILLNKVDLISGEQQSKIEESIRSVHPTAPIRSTTFSQIPDLDWILDADCFGGRDRVQELEQVLAAAAAATTRSEPQHDHDHSHDHSHDHHHGDEACDQCDGAKQHQQQEGHRHTNDVSTISLQQTGTVHVAKMNSWLATILWPNPDAQDKVLRAMLENPEQIQPTPLHEQSNNIQRIYRIKGILSVQHDASATGVIDDGDIPYVDADGLDTRRHIVQGVHDLWEIHPASDNLRWDRMDNEDRTCKMVVIGRCLQPATLKEGFLACFVK